MIPLASFWHFQPLVLRSVRRRRRIVRSLSAGQLAAAVLDPLEVSLGELWGRARFDMDVEDRCAEAAFPPP